MIVVDASALVELLLGRPKSLTLAPRIAAEDLHAPDVVDVEVLSSLRRLEFAGAVSPAIALAAVQSLGRLALTRHPSEPFTPRVWQLRANVSSCDAAYVALAETMAVPLVTCDARLAGAPGHHARIETH